MRVFDVPGLRKVGTMSAVLAIGLVLGACLGGTGQPTSRLEVAVAPLGLTGITNARYTLTVTTTNGIVWTKTIDADRYGDGQGAITYVGPCDGDTPAHTVSLTLDALFDEGGEVTDFVNPTPLSQPAVCVPNRDSPVTFDLTILRPADQGFFDVAVQFEDIFCSAKLDCQEADGSDLELLHHGQDRDMTVVLGFACVADQANATNTWLYLDDLVIDCTGSTTDVRVSPTGLGNTPIDSNPNGYLFAAATYRGVETSGVAYWNAALGLDAAAFAQMGTCVLRTRATAAGVAWPQAPLGFPIPTGHIYPVLEWEVTLSDADSRECATHPIQGGSGVATAYRGHLPGASGGPWSPNPVHLQHRLQPSPGGGTVVSAGAPICNPACDRGACVQNAGSTSCQCEAGYSGPTCSIPVCTSPCLNGGQCVAPDVCACDGTGYEGATCQLDIDECEGPITACAVDATCLDNDGGFVCECLPGFFGDGFSCSACPAGTVQPDAGQSACEPCAAGSYDDGTEVCATCGTCGAGDYVDVACSVSSDTVCASCLPVSGCLGAVTCTDVDDSACDLCPEGYEQPSDGAACTDIDECALGDDLCDAVARCDNTEGGYTCTCPIGTSGDGSVCSECPLGQVQPLEGQPSCVMCEAGTFDDGDEVCATCATCADGDYVLSVCTPEADTVCDTCQPIEFCVGTITCSNTADSVCSQCSDGYEQLGAGATCSDIDECVQLDTCHPDADCSNNTGGFSCACKPGFSGNGFQCEDTDGCAGDPCAGVTCRDVPAPDDGYLCAEPDETSGLTCVPSSLTLGESATCTITPQEDSASISASAASFPPSAQNGSVSAVTPNVGSELSFTWTPSLAGTFTVSAGPTSTSVTVSHTTNAGTTPALAAFDCQDLMAEGVVTSGVYWIDPTGAAPFEVYCEQEKHGGGWTLLFNSVGDPLGQTRAFWDISYAQRFDRKGTPSPTTNFYEPNLYEHGVEYLDVVEDLLGVEAPILNATALGINATTMQMLSPVFVSGSSTVYDYQFSGGWSSPDSDNDLSGSNCASFYGGTQHYGACWRYSLSADADDGQYADGGWGPHVINTVLGSVSMTSEAVGLYSRVNRISRFVRLCPDGDCAPASAAWDCASLLEDGNTASGTYWIQPGTPTPIRAYCEQTLHGGGWTMLFNSVGRLNGPTRAFWQIPYADRLIRKGIASTTTNFYEPTLYLSGGLFLDVAADIAGTRGELFRASAAGINTTSMHIQQPVLLSASVPGGNNYHFAEQFAAGWSSVDADYDTHGGLNCGSTYGATQHYSGCWVYNLGVDADDDGSPGATGYYDQDWGPHMQRPSALNLNFSVGTDAYVRLGRITRFVKPGTATSCLQWKQRGFDTSGLYLLDTDGAGADAPFFAWCDQQTLGGGWTLVSNRRANTLNVESCGTELREFFHQPNGCGAPTAISANDSYALSPTQRTSLPRSEMMMTQYLNGVLDSDDAYILQVPANAGDLFPNTEVVTDIAMSGVCNFSSSTCDTTAVFWRYIGDYWYASSLCNTEVDARDDYSGNYGLCHNGVLSAVYSSSTFAGDRGGYDETKLWAHPNGAAAHQERIWYR